MKLKLLKNAARDYAKKQLAPIREASDKYPFAPFFNEVLNQAMELGFMDICLPESLGGFGEAMGPLCTVLEEICREDSGLGTILFTTAASQKLIECSGPSEVFEEVQGKVLAFPVFDHPLETEAILRVEKKDNTYRLNGAVEYLVPGGIATYAIVPAGEVSSGSFSYYMISLQDADIFRSDPIISLGIHTCPASRVELTNTKAVRIGKKNDGLLYYEKMTDKMNLAAAAMHLGIMKGCYKEALNYSKTRQQGGKRIQEWSELKMMLTEMALTVKASEMLLREAGRQAEQEEISWGAATKAALIKIQEATCELVSDGVQILGGMGT